MNKSFFQNISVFLAISAPLHNTVVSIPSQIFIRLTLTKQFLFTCGVVYLFWSDRASTSFSFSFILWTGIGSVGVGIFTHVTIAINLCQLFFLFWTVWPVDPCLCYSGAPIGWRCENLSWHGDHIQPPRCAGKRRIYQSCGLAYKTLCCLFTLRSVSFESTVASWGLFNWKL